MMRFVCRFLSEFLVSETEDCTALFWALHDAKPYVANRSMHAHGYMYGTVDVSVDFLKSWTIF
jgi:hypothetical protein